MDSKHSQFLSDASPPIEERLVRYQPGGRGGGGGGKGQTLRKNLACIEKTGLSTK